MKKKPAKEVITPTNSPKMDEIDYIRFLIADQRVFTCTEATCCQHRPVVATRRD